jgi:CDGSH-type Zn-finger protein
VAALVAHFTNYFFGIGVGAVGARSAARMGWLSGHDSGTRRLRVRPQLPSRSFDERSLGLELVLAPMNVIATTIYVRPNGPYIITGEFALLARGAPRDDASVVLCRCGRSSNKPYCDGTHTQIGFIDAGMLLADAESNGSMGAGRLVVTAKLNGPLKCTGPMKVSGADGRIRECRDICLCRCGGSATKPFCDGTHTRIAFVG